MSNRTLATVEQSEPWQGVPSADRRLCYWLAATTGLRAGEIKALLVADFSLAGDAPGVTIRAQQAKNANTEPLPLPRDLADALKAHLKTKVGSTRALRLPHVSNFARMLQHDLDAARRRWLADAQDPEELERRKRSVTLRYTDDTGAVLDFHALRHTRGVWLFEHHRANPKEVQTLMRLSSLALVDRYTRSYRLKDKTIADRGPGLRMSLPEQAKAVGTFDAHPVKSPQIQTQIKNASKRAYPGPHRHADDTEPGMRDRAQPFDSKRGKPRS